MISKQKSADMIEGLYKVSKLYTFFKKCRMLQVHCSLHISNKASWYCTWLFAYEPSQFYCESEMNLSLYGKSFPTHVLCCITKGGFEAIVHFLCSCYMRKQFCSLQQYYLPKWTCKRYAFVIIWLTFSSSDSRKHKFSIWNATRWILNAKELLPLRPHDLYVQMVYFD